jgi:hypothetical protein
MAKDAVATMGGLLPDDAGGRDAVHVAVFSAVSAEKLVPGQDVALNAQGSADSEVSATGEHIGIVDPFLKAAVSPGSRFWVYLYPRTITGLAHQWSHPAFGSAVDASYAPPSAKLTSEQWVRAFADRVGLGYAPLMEGASNWLEDQRGSGYGEYLCFGGLLEGQSVPDEFWDHYETITGDKAAPEHRGTFFTCSC